MKKFFATVLSLAFVMTLFTACGGSTATSAAASAKDYDLSAIVSAIEVANPVSNPLAIEDFAMENDFNLTMDNIVDYKGEMSNDQGNSALVLVIKAADGKAADVKAELETYQQNQVAYYGNYAEFADGMANIENGVITEAGDYVTIVFANTEGADYEAINSAVSAAFN